MSLQKRKEDTRKKIEMGGLIIKAKLDYLHEKDKDILLGVLVDASQKLQQDTNGELRKFFSNLGKDAFSK